MRSNPRQALTTIRERLTSTRALLVLALLAVFVVGVEAGRLSIPNYTVDLPGPSPSAGDVFLRYPYLMQPRTDGVTIGWLTPTSVTSGTVRYSTGGRFGAPVKSETLAQADGILQDVRLTGLRPGTPYEYEVASGNRTVTWPPDPNESS